MIYADVRMPISCGLTSVAWVARKGGADRKNAVKQITRSLYEGTALGKILLEKLWRGILQIHRETPLHTFDTDIYPCSVFLRRMEDDARSRLKKAGATARVQEVRTVFEEEAANFLGVFRHVLEAARSLHLAEARLSTRDRTTLYIAASVLHGLVVIWHEAADAMIRAEEFSNDGDGTLCIVERQTDRCVSSMAEEAFALYTDVECELNTMLVRAKKENLDQRQFKLLEHDMGIVNLNIASVASSALDFRGEPYRSILGDLDADAPRRLAHLAESLTPQARRRMGSLMEAHPRHMLIGRNCLYIALQFDDVELFRRAANQLTDHLKIERDELWPASIAGRTPLIGEPALAHAFRDGRPTLLGEEIER